MRCISTKLTRDVKLSRGSLRYQCSLVWSEVKRQLRSVDVWAKCLCCRLTVGCGLFGHEARLWGVANSTLFHEVRTIMRWRWQQKLIILYVLRCLIHGRKEGILVPEHLEVNFDVVPWSFYVESNCYRWQMNIFIVKSLRKCHERHLCVDWRVEKYLVQIKRRFDVY